MHDVSADTTPIFRPLVLIKLIICFAFSLLILMATRRNKKYDGGVASHAGSYKIL
jgi:hypothetical protein